MASADPQKPATNATPADRSSTGFGLRLILQALLVLTVIPAATAVTILINLEAREVLGVIAESSFRSIARGTTAKIHERLVHVPRGLAEINFLLSQHDLDLDEEEDLRTLLLTQAIGHSPGTMIGYGSVDGSVYMLARRNGAGADVLAGQGPEIHASDEAPVDHADFHKAAWFKRGLEARGAAWTRTYRFSGGQTGISAVLAHRPGPNRPPLGVFHVDIPLDTVEEWLATLEAGPNGRVFIVHHDGRIAALPRNFGGILPGVDALARAGVAALTDPLHGLRDGQIHSASFTHEGVSHHVAVVGVDVMEGLDWHVGIVVPEDDMVRLAYDRMTSTVVFAGAATVLMILLGAFFAYRIAAPLRTVTRELGEVSRMRISDTVPAKSMVREVSTLGEALGAMKSALHSLERYIPPEVARRLVTSGEGARIGVEQRQLSIYMSDIEGFTGITETIAPDVLVHELNLYFDEMTEIVSEHAGTIDKFMGDGILAFFNAPEDVPDHAAEACRAALHTVRAMEASVETRAAAGRPVFRIRVGLAVGDVLVGNVGSSKRFGYTVIGDTVNVSARLEGVNKAYGTRIIAADDLRRQAGAGFEWRSLDRVAVAGRAGGLPISELIGLTGEVPADALAARDRYEAALAAYMAGDFVTAARDFAALHADRPDDRAAIVMAERSGVLAAGPTPEPWDGVYVFRTK